MSVVSSRGRVLFISIPRAFTWHCNGRWSARERIYCEGRFLLRTITSHLRNSANTLTASFSEEFRSKDSRHASLPDDGTGLQGLTNNINNVKDVRSTRMISPMKSTIFHFVDFAFDFHTFSFVQGSTSVSQLTRGVLRHRFSATGQTELNEQQKQHRQRRRVHCLDETSRKI